MTPASPAPTPPPSPPREALPTSCMSLYRYNSCRRSAYTGLQMALLGNQCKYAYYKGAAVLALPDGEVNGIGDGTNKAATWWA